MKRSLLVFSFFVGNISLLLLSFYLLTTMAGSQLVVPTARVQTNFAAVPAVLGASTHVTIEPADIRAAHVNIYLKRYRSPFHDLGDFIVNMADKYGIPYNLVPAIAQCESNVGKKVPPESHNAWGYGVYGGKILKFDDWYQAIERVSRGLREDYYDQGLNTPESIMKKYTPPSDGSWARCVERYMKEME